jgi:hypothetical protein
MPSFRPLPLLLSLSALCAALLAPSAASAHKLADVDFHIKKGKHDASNEGLRVHLVKLGKKHDRRVAFKVNFPQSVIYTTSNPANQSDANKVMGISVGRIHEDSIRLGWTWDPKANKVQLRFYAYYNAQRQITDLIQVPLDQWVDVEIKMNDSGMSVRAGSAFVEKQVPLGWKGLTTTAILRTAYFGGDETAPHDIIVKVKDIDAE